jgi:hypothetical protein
MDGTGLFVSLCKRSGIGVHIHGSHGSGLFRIPSDFFFSMHAYVLSPNLAVSMRIENRCRWCGSTPQPDLSVILYAPVSALSPSLSSPAASLAPWRHRTRPSRRLHARAQPFDTPLRDRAHHGYPAPVPLVIPSAAPSSRSERVSAALALASQVGPLTCCLARGDILCRG